MGHDGKLPGHPIFPTHFRVLYCICEDIVGNQASLPGLFVMVFVLRDKTAYIISDDEKRIEW